MEQDTPQATDSCTNKVSIDDVAEVIGFQLPELVDSEKISQRLGN